MVRFQSGVDDQRALAAPVLVLDELADAIHVGGWVAAGECDPEEIVKRSGREVGIVDKND